MEKGTKLRILYLLRYLIQNSDASHPVGTPKLIQVLQEEYGIHVSRNTIHDDLVSLQNCGFNIQHYESTQNKYFFDGHRFEPAELKLLIDAITASKFLPPQESQKLIEKLLHNSTKYNSDLIRNTAYMENPAKIESEHTYSIIEVIMKAIDSKHKISFLYIDYDAAGEPYLLNNGQPIVISPYALVWDEDRYYVRGYSDVSKILQNYCLEYIKKPPVYLNDAAVPAPEDFTPIEYSRSIFRLDENVPLVKVTLICHKSIMKYILDHFGSNIWTQAIDDEHFRARITLCPTPAFYSWVFGFHTRVKIERPSTVRNEYIRGLQVALQNA